MLAASAILGAATPATAAPSGGAAGPVRFALPAPTGARPVGVTSLHLVDHTRPDPWKPDRKREVMVTVRYPARAVGSTPRAAWTSPAMAPYFDELAASPDYLGLPRGRWTGHSSTHSYAGVPADRSGGRRPVVLYSPGLGGNRDIGTTVAEELASRGYVVVTIDHTYESFAVEFPGGRVETGLPIPPDAPEVMKKAIDARVADTRFVVDALTRLAAGHNPDAAWRPLPLDLCSSLDMSKLGMFGHSFGGFTAGESMYHDGRIDAGINLDGAMFRSVTRTGPARSPSTASTGRSC